ncbi:3825_t:CDS:2 [Cetraspora pellucida]|uniref:3825_t:CDS:1 n=1 Tax=Cetraspora pellucida TaxID=1433469 RepID=A0ACA9RB06_9GLOM|nr:3825_t:CDS:2 [Cetraspora pellucida]
MHPNFEQLCRKWTHHTVSEGIDDIDTWFIKRDLAQHQQDAEQW